MSGYTSRALITAQYRVDPQVAIRYASQRYDIPSEACMCISSYPYNMDEFNRPADPATLGRMQPGTCNSYSQYGNVNTMLANETMQLRPHFRYSTVNSRGYDTLGFGRQAQTTCYPGQSSLFSVRGGYAQMGGGAEEMALEAGEDATAMW